MHNKKGVSPLIATVLVIGFTIVLAALVITWGTRLFQTTVVETETQSTFSVACSTGLKLEVIDRELNAAGWGLDTVNLRLRNNNQDQAISNFTVVLNFADGTSENGVINPDSGVSVVLEYPVPRLYSIHRSSAIMSDVAANSGNFFPQNQLDNLESVDLYIHFTIDGITRSCEDPINIEVS